MARATSTPDSRAMHDTHWSQKRHSDLEWSAGGELKAGQVFGPDSRMHSHATKSDGARPWSRAKPRRTASHVPVALHTRSRVGRPFDASLTDRRLSNEVTKPSTIGKLPAASTGEWRPLLTALATRLTVTGTVAPPDTIQTVSPTAISFASLSLEQHAAPTGR